MKIREKESSEVELSTICRQLKLPSSDGKNYRTDCANTKGVFRIIQSIPSSKAESLKLWLAKVGYERVQEIEDPELAHNRAREYYEMKGYPKEWIEKRLREIAIRQELIPYYGVLGIILGITYKAGKIVNTINYVGSDVRVLKNRFEHFEKRFSKVENEHNLCMQGKLNIHN